MHKFWIFCFLFCCLLRTNFATTINQAEPPAADGTIEIHDLKLEIPAQRA